MDEKTVRMVGNVAVTLTGAVVRDADMPVLRDAVDVAVNMAALIASRLEAEGIQTEPRVSQILKNNSKQIGCTFMPEGGTVAPTIYPQQIMSEGRSFDEAVDEGFKMAKSGIQNGITPPELTAEGAKEHIRLVLVNSMMNAEMLETTPHFDVAGGELAAVPRWQINDEASFLVTESLCSHLGITGDEALAFGQKNVEKTEYQVESMCETLMKMMGEDIPEEIMMEMIPPMSGPEMLVVTAPNKVHGAAAMLDEKTMQQVHERLGGDFVVLPSSIHEVICLPISDDMNPRDLRSMVQEVNGTQVRPEERLSDQVFRCDGHKLTLVGESLKPQMDSQKMKPETMKFAM